MSLLIHPEYAICHSCNWNAVAAGNKTKPKKQIVILYETIMHKIEVTVKPYNSNDDGSVTVAYSNSL